MSTFCAVNTPQHVMNLAQAVLGGTIRPDVDCVVFDYRRGRNSYTSRVLSGTTHLLGQLLPQVKFRIWPLWRGISNAQIALAVRKCGRNADTLVLGMYPSGLWERSQLRQEGCKTILLDDGASSLSLDFAQVLDDGNSLGRSLAYRNAVRALAGRRPTNATATPVLYTAFPVANSPWPTVTHDYSALREALKRDTARDIPMASTARVWLDSNYGPLLGADCHRAMISSAIQEFGVDTYVPHRRTSFKFSREIAHDFDLAVVRPTVPAELVIGPWTQAGVSVLTPPASLATTGQLFVEDPGSLTMVCVSEWLRQYRERHGLSGSEGFREEILNAETVERSALQGGRVPVNSLPLEAI